GMALRRNGSAYEPLGAAIPILILLANGAVWIVCCADESAIGGNRIKIGSGVSKRVGRSSHSSQGIVGECGKSNGTAISSNAPRFYPAAGIVENVGSNNAELFG